ncbi:RNA polymerase sigma factor YlaC [bacterium BMS3Bbin02]|nr:RNA polymerase sigma factor YlaC [bacterium BMS3Bbin02]
MTEDDAVRRRRFEELFDENFRSLLGYAMRRLSDTTAAADVVSETFLAAWRRLDDVPAGSESRLWLYGTARRVLSNYHRGERRRGALVTKLGAHLESVASLLDESSVVSGIIVREALGRLPDDDADLLRLTAWEGLSPVQLARMWGIPTATVRTRLHRARLRLKAELDSEQFDPAGHIASEGYTDVRGPKEES